MAGVAEWDKPMPKVVRQFIHSAGYVDHHNQADNSLKVKSKIKSAKSTVSRGRDSGFG